MPSEREAPGSAKQVWTVASILRTVTPYLKERNCQSPRLDAEILLAHVLGASRVELYTGHDRPLLPAELASYRELVRRRSAGEPAAYLVGCREFYSLDFEVGPGVLVPRPESEFLASAAIEEARSRGGAVRAADIGTGSGCIAVALAVYAPECDVAATEKSAAAAAFARRNAVRHNVHERVTVAEGELLEPLKRMGLKAGLDILVSNPPYISEGEFESLPVTVREYEPREALVAGEDGTEYHRAIADAAPEFLRAGGLLALEVGLGQARKVRQIVLETGRYEEPRVMRDYGGIERVVLARRV
jgi:release factor glutamine methyltransferase